MADKKKKKEKTSVVLPKAWQSVKHRNETAQARSNYEDGWKAIEVVLIILLVLFVLLGGISQTGALKFLFNWSKNVGEGISNWLEGGSIITNEDGIYWDPTGQNGDKIGDPNAPEVINPMDGAVGGGETPVEGEESVDDAGETDANEEAPVGNSEVQKE